MRCADLEDEFHQYKKEVEDERRSQKGSKLKSVRGRGQMRGLGPGGRGDLFVVNL
jgi:hypothetical protein